MFNRSYLIPTLHLQSTFVPTISIQYKRICVSSASNFTVTLTLQLYSFIYFMSTYFHQAQNSTNTLQAFRFWMHWIVVKGLIITWSWNGYCYEIKTYTGERYFASLSILQWNGIGSIGYSLENIYLLIWILICLCIDRLLLFKSPWNR